MIKDLSKERDLLVPTHEPKTCSWRLDSLAHEPKKKIGLIMLTNQRGRLDSLACKDVFLYLQEELIPCYLLLEFAWVCHVELDTKLQGQSMRA